MNLCVVSTYNGTKEDYLKLYESFKDDIAKYTDGFEMGFVGPMRKNSSRSKEFDAKFNNG